MASINLVQQPTKYTAIHSNNGIKEYQDFNFTFVPIPNNEATHDDLEKDISNDRYYNINNKSFYAEIDTIDHTTPEKLQDSIDNASLEQVVYAPSSDTTTIIYKVSKGDTEEYKCSKDGVKVISFGDDSLKGKGVNASMENVTIHCDDGLKLCSIKNDYEDTDNSVIEIKSTGQVKIEIPNGVVVSSAELVSDDIYLKGTFNSENENTENFFVCNYTKGDEQYCTYNDKIIVPESIISSSGDKSTIQLGNSKVEFTPNKPVYGKFLIINDNVETGGISKDEWESTDNEIENSEYPLYVDGSTQYVRIGDTWVTLNDVKYSYDEGTNKVIITGGEFAGRDITQDWTENSEGLYLQYVTYVKKVSVVDTNNLSEKGYYSIKNGVFEEGFTLDKSTSFQQVISGFFNETGNACALDKNFYLVVDTNTNKIIYKDGSATLASLEYNTSSN